MRRSALIALWILAVTATIWLLRTGSQLLIPIAIGILISYILEPIVAWLERHRCPRIAGASIVMLTILGLFAWGVYSLRDDVVQATEALPQAARRAREMLTSQGASGPGANVRKAAEELRGIAAAPQEGGGAQQRASSAEQGGSAGSEGGATTGLIQQGVGSVLALAGHLVTIVFLVFFLLLSGAHFRQRLVEIAGPSLERRKITTKIIDDINAHIQRFLLVTAFTAVVVALATWALLASMGVRQAAVWAMLAGVFNSIPYFGPVIVSGGLMGVGLLQTGDVMQGLKLSGAALAITSLEGWLITPPLMGKAERINALVVFLGLLLWTWLWGAWGTVLAVPMLVVVKSVADHIEPLKPLSRLMAP